MRVKLFTVDQAEKALPLVRRILTDISKHFQEAEDAVLERQKLGAVHSGTRNEERAFALEREIEQHEGEIERFQKELGDIGVELKEPRIGLIDFYSRYEGRIVYLCWKLDEGETLAWFHDLNAGFRGRQPITPVNRTRFKGLEPGERFVEIEVK